MADYLELDSSYFELTKAYDKWQDLSKSHPEDGSNYYTCVLGRGWFLTEDILKKLHSVTPTIPTPPD